MKTKIAIFSGSRSEYGFIEPIVQSLKKKNSDIYLITSNSHFQKKFGSTIKEFKKDKLIIKKKIIPPKSKKNFILDSNLIIIRSITNYLSKINPKYFLIYGDRFETFTAVYACSFLNIPIIHIEGGDITEGGTYDDIFRHAITKLSHLHIATNKISKMNLSKLGEEKWRIKKFGVPSLDNIKKYKLSNYDFLKTKYKLNDLKSFVIFTIHPLSNDLNKTKKEIDNSLRAMIKLSELYFVVITYPNNDKGSDYIIKKINQISKLKKKNILIVKNLGGKDYFGFLNFSNSKNLKSVCVGNSSSGIKEAKSFNCPTINIGDRQKGRMKTKSVIDCKPIFKEIVNKCIFSLENNNFRNSIKRIQNPYYVANSSLKITNLILNNKYNLKKLLRKKLI